MGSKAGIWIDHRHAVVVELGPSGERVTRIDSLVEKHLERSGDSPLKGRYEAAQVPPDDRRQRALTGELNVYYDAVISAVRDADSLILFGPGEAKVELQKRLTKHRLGERVHAVDAADKMTDKQIAARVREHYSGPRAARGPEVGRPIAGVRGESPED